MNSDPHRKLASEVVPKSRSGRSGRIRNEKRRRVYEYYWAHFAAEIHLSEKSPFRPCGRDLVEFFNSTGWAFSVKLNGSARLPSGP